MVPLTTMRLHHDLTSNTIRGCVWGLV